LNNGALMRTMAVKAGEANISMTGTASSHFSPRLSITSGPARLDMPRLMGIATTSVEETMRR